MSNPKWQKQNFFRSDADRLFPRGCSCFDDSGSCDWCHVYYEGDEDDDGTLGETQEEKSE